MSTTRKIAHNTLVQMVGKVISTLLGLVAVGMMTRYLGVEQFGWYVTVITFLQFVGILIDFGLIPVTAQMMSEDNHDEKTLFQNLLGFRFTTAVLFLAITPVIALFFPYPIEVKIAIAFTTISFLAIAMNQILIGYYQTKLRMHVQAVGEIVGRVVLVAGLWGLIALGEGFLPVMGIITLSSVAYTWYMWHIMKRDGIAGFRYDMPVWKEIWAKSWPITIAIIFNVVYLKGDTLLLSLFRDQTEVGIYGAAYRVIDVLAQTAMMVVGIMLPLLAASWAKRLSDEFRERYQQAFDIMMMLAIPMVVGTMILAEPIMRLIAGDAFAGSGMALRVLALAVFGVYLGAVFGHTAVAINRQKSSLWVYVTNAVITVTGYLIVIPRFGMMGAAWMTVFSELYAGILLFFVVRHYSRQHLSFVGFGKMLFAAGVMSALLYQIPTWNLGLQVVLGGAVYGLILMATGVVSKQTIEEILTLKRG